VLVRRIAASLMGLVGLGLLLYAIAGGSVPTSRAAAAATGSGPVPCGASAQSPVPITKVLVMILENTDFGAVIGSPAAPNINGLARACGLATNYHGIQFPSLPNYLAMTSGQVPAYIAGDGSTGRDCLPHGACTSADPSIFSQIDGRPLNLSWRTYAESMPQPCFPGNQGLYVARHNSAVYYTGIRASCQTNDVPMGTPVGGALADDLAAGTLPSYGVLVPNLCNDGHDACNGQDRISEEDQTVATWLPTIMSSADYRSGHLLIVITADTSRAAANGNQVATILINPDIPPGTQSAARYDHYALLRLTDQLLGLAPLANAAHAADIAAAFNLPSPPTQPLAEAPRAR
jgi:hypothetical protein